MHLSPNFDTEKPVWRWFICDLNVNCRLDRNGELSLSQKCITWVYKSSSDFAFLWCFFPKPSILRRQRNSVAHTTGTEDRSKNWWIKYSAFCEPH